MARGHSTTHEHGPHRTRTPHGHPGPAPVLMIFDGACSGQGTARAIGGWAVIIITPDGREHEFSGYQIGADNNEMELLAMIEGLRRLPDGTDIDFITDSGLIRDGLAGGHMHAWRERDWRNKSGKRLSNPRMWEEIYLHMVRVGHTRIAQVQGHSGHDLNERADRLAVTASRDGFREAYPGERLPGSRRRPRVARAAAAASAVARSGSARRQRRRRR